ncbi:MAG: penicillin-binding protein activator [Oceanospirillaceae bacterium]|nr:penicillin-binding protein activator [Oceanospirillaceae bacterium]
MTGNRFRLLWQSLLTVALLAGCAAPPQTGQAPQTDKQMSVEQLLASAAGAQPLRAAELKLQAAKILQQRGDFSGAVAALDGVDPSILPPNLRFDVARVRAGAALERKDAGRALQFLDSAQFPGISATQQVELSRLRAQAYEQQNNSLAAALELIQVARTATGDELSQVNDLVWRQLLQVDTEALVAASLNNYGFYEQGWIELALSLSKQADLSTQRDALMQWQQLWGAHPAYTNPPRSLAALLNADLITPQRVLVALPFSGSLAEPARILSEGINAALYQRKAQNLPVPTLITLDTEQITSASEILNYARQQRAELIIGPLKGNLIDQLAADPTLPIPVIAFNQTTNTNPNVYTIDLSSDQDIRQVVERAVIEGRKRFAIITPAANWGQKALTDYQQAILANEAEIATTLQYQSSEDLSAQVSQMLHTDLSKNRYTEIRQTLGQKIEFSDRPRRDIDAILITASAQDARSIKPMLAFHFAGDYPVYATSHLYDGDPNAVRDVDLNGIQFPDLPWLLQPNSAVNLQLGSERSDTQSRLGRLYALGADAFTLYPFLRQLESSDEIYFDGLTGRLTLGTDKRVKRELVWAAFDEGIPVLLGPPIIPEPTLPADEALFAPSN